MVSSEYKLELARIKSKEKIELKRLGSSKARYSRTLTPIQPAPMLSKEQDMMNDLFGGRGENRVMFQNPSSECRTELRGGLMPSNMGNDFENETASIFGF